jgi:hypothetical protein
MALENKGTEQLEEIIVPIKMKPYINKEISFKLFIDILMDKIDE